MYFANNLNLQKLEKNKKNIEPKILKDIIFYKERIKQQNLDLLEGKNVDENINNSYRRYLYLTIQHFKFIDKVDIIQKDYEGIEVKKEKNVNFNLDKINKIIRREKRNVGKLTDVIDIKIKYNKERKLIIPQKKIINLKDEYFKTKGLKKENITNILDNETNNSEKSKKKNSKEEKEKKKKKA